MSTSVVEVGTFTTDASLVVRTWDDSLHQSSGIAPDEAVGRPLADVIPSLAPRGLLPRFEDVIASGAVHVFSPALHRYLLPCPPSRPSARFDQMQQRVTVGPLRDGEHIKGVIVSIQDVTARLDAERDLAESLAAGKGDWRVRRTVVEGLSGASSSDFAVSLVELVRTHHRDFDMLSSTLQLLAGTAVDVSPALAELLQDDDADLRLQAALALGEQRSETAEQALIAALTDPEPNVRFQAVESLGRLRAYAAVDRLAAIAERDDPFVAFAAVQALAEINDPRIASRLLPLLGRDDIAAAVIEALGALGDEEVLEPLVSRLDESPASARSVAIALGGIHDRLEAGFGHGRLVADRVRRAITPRGEKHLVQSAATAGEPELPAFARVLGWLAGEEARRALVGMLAFPGVQAQILESIARGGEGFAPLLIPLLGNHQDEIARAAIVALGTLGSREATPKLVALLSEKPALAGHVVGALARLGDVEAFEPLLRLLGHREAVVRQAAIGALNSIGHPDMPTRVIALLESDDAVLRESAVRIAGYFGYAAAAARIVALTQDPVESVRSAAIEQLPYFDQRDATPRVIDALTNESSEVRAAAARALCRVQDDMHRGAVCAALIRALQDESWWVRYYAARSLGEQRRVEALDALVAAATSDAVPPVRIVAIEAVTAIAPRHAAPALMDLASGENDEVAASALRALAHVPTPASLQRLVSAARGASAPMQLAAADSLASHDDVQAIETLQSLAAFATDGDVRQAAMRALGTAAARQSPAGDAALEILVAMRTDRERHAAAAAALSRLPDARLDGFNRLLRHQNVATRIAVVETLGRYSAVQATTLLMDALSDEAASVRETAVRMLERRRHDVV